MNVCEHLTIPATLFPEREAVVFENQRWTYAEINRLSALAASRLQEHGVKRGERVGMMLPNAPAFIVWYYAALRIGSVAVSISTRLAPAEVGFMLEDCDAVCFIADAQNLEAVRSKLPPSITCTLSCNESGDECDGIKLERDGDVDPCAFVATEPDDPALILYTSGTTGFAKGATLSHRNVRATVHAFNHLCQMDQHDRLLLAVPLFHCYGQNALLNSGFNVGATIVLQRRFDLNESKRLISEERVTKLFGVPTTFQLLEECCTPEDLKSITYCFSAAATLPIQVSRRWHAKFGMPIYEGYGLTETAPFASYNHRLHFEPGSIGTPVDLVEMKIVDTDSGETCVPGELGEIAIRGPNVMLGYWNRPEDTKEAIRDGWFHSGDIGRVDERGYFYIVDRVKDMIAIGGMKVFPAEVERVMLDHDYVSEVAVVGFPDEVFGERVVAVVVPTSSTPTPGPSADSSIQFETSSRSEDLRKHCESQLATFKVPRQFVEVAELPRNPAGKVLKTRLRELEIGPTATYARSGPDKSSEASQVPPQPGADSMLAASVRTSADDESTAGDHLLAGDQGAWLAHLRRLHRTRRSTELTRLIAEEVRQVLGHDSAPAAKDRFLDVGLDSLMIVELRDRMQIKVGPQVELPSTLVFDHPRVCDLAEFLTEALEAADDPEPSSDRLANEASSAPQTSRAPTPSAPVTEDKHGSLHKNIRSMSEDQALEELMRELNE